MSSCVNSYLYLLLGTSVGHRAASAVCARLRRRANGDGKAADTGTPTATAAAPP